MKIQPTAYTPVKTEQTARTAPAKAEEKDDGIRPGEQDKVELSKPKPKPETPATYTPPKKLSSDQMRSIRDALSAQQTQLLQAMTGNSVNQANSFFASLGQKNPMQSMMINNGKLPPLATTQEGALAAISEGGAYSVDAVATRIFNMAESMAGDDPEMLKKMQEAVEKGFKAAGVDFKKATGQGLPSISSQTYDEVMSRFEKRFEELGVAGKTETADRTEKSE